jgi:hypothetical protein
MVGARQRYTPHASRALLLRQVRSRRAILTGKKEVKGDPSAAQLCTGHENSVLRSWRLARDLGALLATHCQALYRCDAIKERNLFASLLSCGCHSFCYLRTSLSCRVKKLHSFHKRRGQLWPPTKRAEIIDSC